METQSIRTIYLDFTSLTCCGFFVNGVDGLISTGPYASGYSGFYSGNQPAILNSNLIVTYLPGLPPPVITAINFYTDETNGSANLDGLIEGIRYGGTDDDNDKPECS
jgi:hypothetical protein